MAKVKNQILPAQEIIYYDNPNDSVSLGSQYRAIANESYPQSHDSDQGIVKKSSQGRRPSTKGWGSPKQMRVRAAFKQCIMYWKMLPESCEEAVVCYQGPTKNSVWQTKVDYGLLCSYLDVFMRCCIKTLYHTTGDWRFDDMWNCQPAKCDTCCHSEFPNDSYSVCNGDSLWLVINNPYGFSEFLWAGTFSSDSTLEPLSGEASTFHAMLKGDQMGAQETVFIFDREASCKEIAINIARPCPGDLQIENILEIVFVGDVDTFTISFTEPTCPGFELQWGLSGVGSLEQLNNRQALYHAPNSIVDCNNAAVLTITCDGIIMVERDITITIDDQMISHKMVIISEHGTCAHESFPNNPEPYREYYLTDLIICELWIKRCSGETEVAGTWSYQNAYSWEGGSCAINEESVLSMAMYHFSLGGLPPNEWIDIRTPAQIEAGCCPP